MRLIPRDEKFHELFIEHGERVAEAASKLNDLMSSYTNVQEQVASIRGVEKEGDKLVGEVHRRGAEDAETKEVGLGRGRDLRVEDLARGHGHHPLPLHRLRQPHPVRRGDQSPDPRVPPLHGGW